MEHVRAAGRAVEHPIDPVEVVGAGTVGVLGTAQRPGGRRVEQDTPHPGVGGGKRDGDRATVLVAEDEGMGAPEVVEHGGAVGHPVVELDGASRGRAVGHAGAAPVDQHEPEPGGQPVEHHGEGRGLPHHLEGDEAAVEHEQLGRAVPTAR